jgi:cyclophilin family peptidyl-prolyl cis-trans isomerase/protein-disulfide isomerase
MRKAALFLISIVFLSSACTPATKNTLPPTASMPARPDTPVPDVTCTYAPQPTPNPKDPSIFAPISVQDHVRGAADAYLTIMEYSDFQCPACAKFAAALAKIQQEYPKDIRVVFREYPLIKVNDKAAISAQAAEAAALQGKFWEMHDLLFAKQEEWVKLEPAKFPAWVVQQAASLDLDVTRFKSDLTSAEIAAIPQQAWQDGQKINLPGVPLILMNGEIMKWGPMVLNNLESIIRMDLLAKRQFKSCPPYQIDPTKEYRATLKTTKGDIVMRLFVDKAPNTVNNFVFLARAGWYDHITFHRVVPNFIVQTGDPSGTGQGNPGYFIPNEIVRTLQYDRPGLVGMTNSGPDTNGSQFFITLAAAPRLTGIYTMFGQVISGMDVLQKLTPRDPNPGEDVPDGDVLNTVQIEEK